MKQIDNSVKITLIIASVVLILGLMVYSLFDATNTSDTLRSNGQVTIDVSPDLVVVNFNIETTGDTTQEAKDSNSVIVDELTTELIKIGFERKDIQTQSFNIYENCEWKNNEQVCEGYKATHLIRVEFSTDKDVKIVDVIDSGANAGAGINYISFELSNEKQQEYKAEAMKLAAQDARIKAEAVAEGLDKNLGDLVSVSINDFGYSPWRVYDSAGGYAEASVAKESVNNIQPSDKEISASVSAVFEIR